MFSRLGRWLTNGAFVCNGHELARAYRSPRTIAAVSSTVQEMGILFSRRYLPGPNQSAFFSSATFARRRELSTCSMPSAFWMRVFGGNWKLLDRTNSRNTGRRLDEIVETRCASAIAFAGRVICHTASLLFDRMRAADIFVLPTLSEGTPHVLVEARANGLPCISTTVGGVPSTVRHGFDALLVPPGNPEALARAIDRIIRDGELRRALIRNGWSAARWQTLERFVATVRSELETKSRHASRLSRTGSPRIGTNANASISLVSFHHAGDRLASGPASAHATSRMAAPAILQDMRKKSSSRAARDDQFYESS